MQDLTFHNTLSRTLEIALSYVGNLDQMPVASTIALEDLRQRLGRPLTDTGIPAELVVRDLVEDVDGAIMGSAGGRFFGWAIGGSLPAALAADWLSSTWDQNAALYSCGPAAAVVEEVAGAWLKELLGLPPDASFAFVTGTQMSHFTCLAAARHSVLERRGWDVEQRGLCCAPPIRILCNEQRHGSIERAVRSLGLGSSQIVDVPTDSVNRVIPGALSERLREGASSPTIVVLQAGDFCTGAFDDFTTLVPIARQYDAWVHVDGAFGLWAKASPQYRDLAQGVELADSWTADGHKWLNIPFDCGYSFVADPKAHRAAMSHRASYLTHDEQARDQIDWNPEWSRRARGFPTYAAVRQLGRKGVADLIERCCRHASSLVSLIGSLPGAQILAEPTINQGVIRFLDLRSGASDEDHDRKTDEVVAEVAASGEAFFTGITWRGRRVMRVSVCNWRTGEADVRRAVDAFRRVLAPVAAETSH
jgi:aromatic-L-amino-acid decarboxylase